MSLLADKDICPFTANKIFFKYGYFCRYDYLLLNIAICNYRIIFTKIYPLGDANKRSSVERAFESKFCAFFLFDRLPFSKAFSAAAEQPGRGVLSPSRCVRGLTDPPPPNTFGGQALPVNVYPPPVHGDTGLLPASCLAFPSSTDAPPKYLQDMCMQLPCTKPSLPTYRK